MKAKLALVVLLVAVLALGGVGCNKATGGGWFIDDTTGYKITFGFNAKPTVDYTNTDTPEEVPAKGQFQLVDHGTKTRIHGSFDGTWSWTSDDISSFFGTSIINGTDVQPFNVQFYDNGEQGLDKGDGIIVHIGSTDPNGPITLIYSGELGGVNIKVHEK